MRSPSGGRFFLAFVALQTVVSFAGSASDDFQEKIEGNKVLRAVREGSDGGRKLQTHPGTGQEEEHQCELALIARDFFGTNLPEHDAACIDATSGEFLDLDLPPETHGRFRSGDTLTVHGQRHGANARGSSQARLSVRTWNDHRPGISTFPQGQGQRKLSHVYTGIRTAVVLQIRFVDANDNVLGTGMNKVAKRRNVASTINSTLFGTYAHDIKKTHAGTWEECSYGKLKLDFDVDGQAPAGHFSSDFPNDGSDIFYIDVPIACTAGVGYCTRTYNSATTCSSSGYYGWPEYALKKLEAEVAGFSRSNWQHYVVVFDRTATACNFFGMGNTGCSNSYCYSWIPHDNAHYHNAFTHEMGHNLGIAHAGMDPSSGATGNDQEYGDMSSAMGWCCSVRCYNGPHAFELGWLPALELDDSNIVLGSTTHYLKSMSLTDVDSLIAITANWPGGDGNTYWLQFKTAHSYDTYMESHWRNNVQIKSWNQGAYERTDDMGKKLTQGQSWTDPSGEITVTVQDIDVASSFQATLTITRAGGCTQASDCEDGDLCTQHMCDPSNPLASDGGCVNTPIDCSGLTDACSTGECVGGTCLGVPVQCNDNVLCTDDSCNVQAGGCQFVPDNNKCDDGNACTLDTCDLVSGCEHAEMDCSSLDGPCTLGVCIEGTCTEQETVCNEPEGPVGDVNLGVAVDNVLASTDTVEVVGGVEHPAYTKEQITNGQTDKFFLSMSAGESPGFEAVPSAACAIVTGLKVFTTFDLEQCDPTSFIVEGRRTLNDDYEVIKQGALPLPEGRNVAGTPADSALFYKLVNFQNVIPYAQYRVTFPTVKGPELNWMQVGEVQLSGYFCSEDYVAPPTNPSPTPAPVNTEGDVNLALGKTTTQSSVFAGGESTRAVDGNTNGMWSGNSVTHTNDIYPFWSVDLGGEFTINEVVLWNRMDCCQDALKYFIIELLDADGNQVDAQIHQDYPATAAVQDLHFPFDGVVAQTVVVHLYSSPFLTLAEVQVFGKGESSNVESADLIAVDNVLSSFDTVEAIGGIKHPIYTENQIINGQTDKFFLTMMAGENPGFEIIPSAPCTVVTGLKVFTPADLEQCDPTSFIVEGRRTLGGNYEVVKQGSLPLPEGRNAAGTSTEDAPFYKLVTFPNVIPYAQYRVTFPTVKGPELNWFQIGEAQLPGYLCQGNYDAPPSNPTPAPSPVDTEGDTNVALGKTTTQSSIFNGGEPSRAVDGDTNGLWWGNSVTHTNDVYPFWSVDLGGEYVVNEVVLWNRMDCCQDALKYFIIELLDTNGNQIDAQIHEDYPATSEVQDLHFPFEGVVAQHVTVHLYSSSFLMLAEVQVFGKEKPLNLGVAVNNILASSDTVEATGGVEHPVYLKDQIINGQTDKFFLTMIAGENPGFEIVPSAPCTIVTGLKVFTSSDLEQGDPTSFIVEGRRTLDGVYEVITQGALPLPEGRNVAGTPADDALFYKLVSFPNVIPYAQYRVTFPTVKGPELNWLQIGEVQLPGHFCPEDYVAPASNPVNAVAPVDREGDVNLALGKMTTQSSVFGGGESSRAVDGNVDGMWSGNSVTLTNDMYPFWSVDLEGEFTINEVVLWNRMDCCQDALNYFIIELLDTHGNQVDAQIHVDYPATAEVQDLHFLFEGVLAQHVTVHLYSSSLLALAEVQVFGKGESSNVESVDVDNVLSSFDTVEAVGGIKHPFYGENVIINGKTDKFFLTMMQGENPGIEIVPSAPCTIVTGLKVFTSIDLEQCDPTSFIIEGRRTLDSNYEVIKQGALPLPEGRNVAGAPVDDALFYKLVSFPNVIPYAQYRVSFPTVKGPELNWLQVGEVQLPGTLCPKDYVAPTSNATENVASVDTEGDINLALGKMTTQSSVLGGGESSRAVDGNMDGNWFGNSVTLTNDVYPFWSVDLGGEFTINEVVLWNRMDCCQDALKYFIIELLDTDGNQVDAQIHEDYPATSEVQDLHFPFEGVVAQHVTIHLYSSAMLALAEVQVFGH